MSVETYTKSCNCVQLYTKITLQTQVIMRRANIGSIIEINDYADEKFPSVKNIRSFALKKQIKKALRTISHEVVHYTQYNVVEP